MKLALIGAGGFADEVRAHMGTELKCFVDQQYYKPNNKNILPLSEFDPYEYKVLVAIGDSRMRKNVVDKLPKETQYFTYIHHSVQIIGEDIKIGDGSILCAGVIVTTNCSFGKHTHLNLHTSIGHDNVIGDFFTTAPGARVSGNCNIGDCVYMGTNSSIRQKINVCDDVTLGLNCGVVKDIVEPGTYVGVPAKLLTK
jgi:sugar O-acyltransferase (sialic acid O-acetyltransferase NeuD family)